MNQAAIRVAIIKNKADQYSFELPDEIAEFLASELKNNVRQLESAVKKIKSICTLNNVKPSPEIAKDAIKELTSYSQPVSVINAKIIENVSLEDIGKYFGGKTHSTVKHSIDIIRNRMDNEFQFKKTVEDIIKNVQDF